MAYLGKTPSQAVRSRYYYTATGGETSLSGSDDNSNVLTFTDGNYVDVSLNGATLVAGSDYNTTTTNTIGGLAALTASDIVEVLVYDTFSVFGGNMAANLNFKDNVKANFGTGNDLQIFHDGSNSIIRDAGTGSLKFQYGTSDGVVFDSSGNVGIGTVSPSDLVTIQSPASGGGNGLTIKRNDNGTDQRVGAISFGNTVDSDLALITAKTSVGNSGDGNLQFYTQPQGGSATERLRIASAGSVGINTTTMNAGLNIKQSADNAYQIKLEQHNTTDGYGLICDMTDGALAFSRYASSAYTERMRIDTSGQLIVGHDGSGSPYFNEGIVLNPAGDSVFHRDGNSVVDFSRETSDGSIVRFVKDNSVVGSIQTKDSRLFISGSQGSTPAGIYFGGGGDILPASTTNAVDNSISLGGTGHRWKDLYLSGGVFLGGTGSANYLDDYEFGSWLPNIHKGGSALASSSKNGRYLRIGNVVHLSFYWFSNIGVTTSGGNSWTVQNLPFSVLAINGNFISGGYIGINGTGYGNTSPYRWQANASAYLELYGTQGITNTSSGYTEFSGSGTLYLGA